MAPEQPSGGGAAGDEAAEASRLVQAKKFDAALASSARFRPPTGGLSQGHPAGSGREGAGSGERGAGSGEQGARRARRVAGVGEQGAGSGEQGAREMLPAPSSQLPAPGFIGQAGNGRPSSSPPAPLPKGEGSKTPSPPAPLPKGEGSKTPSPPAPLPQESAGVRQPHPRTKSHRARGVSWKFAAADYLYHGQ